MLASVPFQVMSVSQKIKWNKKKNLQILKNIVKCLSGKIIKID